MKCDRKTLCLYAVTDRAWVGVQSLAEQVESALKGGVTCVQLREKDLPEAAFIEEAKEIREICHRYGVPLFINDNVHVALACQADGIHVGQDDRSVSSLREMVGQSMMIGVSVHSVKEAREAEKAGADCLGAGAVFSTSTKQDTRVLSKEVLHEICEAVSIPVVAIGGIGRENLRELSGTGIAGVALVSAIFGAKNIEAESRYLKALSMEVTQRIF